MENEKVEVLGMIFDKGKEPEIEFLQRNSDGIFYGDDIKYTEEDLINISSYLEGGEIFIDFYNVNVYVFDKGQNAWIGKNEFIECGGAY